MTRRLAPFIALGLALAALTWGLVTLQRMFGEEANEALERLAADQHGLDREATASVLRELEARVSSAPGPTFDAELGEPVLPSPTAEPKLFRRSYIITQTGSTEVSLDAVLLTVARERGEALSAVTNDTQPLRTLSVHVESPRLERAERTLRNRLRLKTSMVIVCAVLAAALSVAGIFIQRRKQRFLNLKSDFVSTVSHELRTPLASIRLLAETLQEHSAAGDPTLSDFPARIVRVADGLHFLVENILSFNQVTKGRWRVERRPVRLDDAIHSLKNDLVDVITKPVHVTLDAKANAALVVDPALFRLLLANLGRNACAYNDRDHVEITIRLNHRELRCTDNGIGIPGNEWDNVFHDFYRLLTSRTAGSGLGLALCRRIMALHRGTITIESSSVERGTTFVMTFDKAAVANGDHSAG